MVYSRQYMKIIITGALGHIGSYIINDLVKIKKIKKIYLVDNFLNSRFNVLFKLQNKKFQFIYGDVSDKLFCKKIPKANIPSNFSKAFLIPKIETSSKIT